MREGERGRGRRERERERERGGGARRGRYVKGDNTCTKQRLFNILKTGNIHAPL